MEELRDAAFCILGCFQCLLHRRRGSAVQGISGLLDVNTRVCLLNLKFHTR